MQLTRQDPFNVTLMTDLKSKLGRVPRILSPDTYIGVTNQLHPEGLFSTALFGTQGSDTRDYLFGYIKLNTKILHPQVCKWLKKLKRINEEIWQGKTFAIFNKQTGEFERAPDGEGDTGYHFFLSHLDQMKFKKNNSTKRNQIIKAMNRYRGHYFLEEHLVLPAGLRDIQLTENGRATEDEINEYYRKLLRMANALEGTPSNQGRELDQIRANMQNTANNIDLYLDAILSGKKGFLLGKWASRRLHLSSRNVITAQDPACDDLDSDYQVTVDTLQMGLFQVIAAAKPLVVSLVRHSEIIQKTFSEGSTYVNAIHPTKLNRVSFEVTPDEVADFLSIEGIEKLTKKFAKQTFRTMPMMIRGHYPALVYRDKEKYQILYDINELPEGWDKNNVRPLTYLEFFYLIGKDKYDTLMVQCTRYPVADEGSVFVADLQVRATKTTIKLQEYQQGQPTESYAKAYPSMDNITYLESISVPNPRIPGLGADFNHIPVGVVKAI